MTLGDVLEVLALLVLAGFVLRWHLWRALLVLRPGSMHLEADAPADQLKLPPELTVHGTGLLKLGFLPLGSHLEKARFGPEQVSYDFAHAETGTYATLYLGPSDIGRLYFLTAVQGGKLVLTANHRRPSREVPGAYLSGSLEHLPVERVFKAHARRAQELGPAEGPPTLEGRVSLGTRWFQGYGAAEVRAIHALGLLWTAGTVGMVLAALLGRRG